MNRINLFLRSYYNKYNQRKLTNKDITLIASNCIGACILHDLNIRFNSPFVNCWLKPADFLHLCENMEYYLGEVNKELRFIEEEGISYPVAMLEDVKIYFQHYLNNEEVKMLWERRKQRIKMDNIFILFTDRDGCTYEDLKRFDNLKYKKKAVFVHKKYPEIESAVYIPGFETLGSVGECSCFRNSFTYKKFYDSFDYVSWFNR